MSKGMVKIVVFTTDRYGDDCVIDKEMSFDDFLRMADEWREATPEEHRANLQIRFGDDGDYDYSLPELSVWYERPETDEEEAARIAQHERWVQDELNRERMRYEALKRKFERA